MRSEACQIPEFSASKAGFTPSIDTMYDDGHVGNHLSAMHTVESPSGVQKLRGPDILEAESVLIPLPHLCDISIRTGWS